MDYRYFNKGLEGYRPFRPSDFIISPADRAVDPFEVDSLWYLTPEHQATEITTVTDYQEWAETGWKQKHGTYTASTRFLGKLLEEVSELGEADSIFVRSGSQLDSEHATELLSELGDVLWCATALASNSTADIDSAIKTSLQEYVDGTSVSNGRDKLPPTWHDEVTLLSHKWHNIAISDISDIIATGFEPRQSPVMTIDGDEPAWGVEGHIDLMLWAVLSLQALVDTQYCYGEMNELAVTSNDYYETARSIAGLCAELYLNVAYVAHHRLGLSLDDVVAKNMAKLNARIEAGRVDKTDGERSTDLL